MQKETIPHPHDRLFRASMQYPEVAREFLEMHLPEYIKKQLDFNSLVICPTSFIDEKLKQLQCDVLFKARFAGKEILLYILVEHQKTPEPLISLRLLKYELKIWDFYYKEMQTEDALLPVIIPLVFYTGNRPYRGEQDYAACSLFNR